MGLWELFSRRRHQELTEAHKEAKRLFDEGSTFAEAFQIDRGLELFDQSFALFEHPAPLLNRAHIKMMRLRYREAMQDLLLAQKLDAKLFDNEFAHQISPLLEKCQLITVNYDNGVRKKLLADRKTNGRGYATKRIFFSCFNADEELWDFYPQPTELMLYHFFNELDNIRKFESKGTYWQIDPYVSGYPDDFVQIKIQSRPPDYSSLEMTLHSFLCCYEQSDMIEMRTYILNLIHNAQMQRDYGMASLRQPRFIREAMEFLGEDN